jgi:hypothetical protein
MFLEQCITLRNILLIRFHLPFAACEASAVQCAKWYHGGWSSV